MYKLDMKYCGIVICFFIYLHHIVAEDTDGNVTQEEAAIIKNELVSNSSQPDKKDNLTMQTDDKDRSAHSKMLLLSLQELFTTTTTEKPTPYAYWWFITTSRRPFISYRDFPGKPGVASWKEISPLVDKNAQANKKDEPTAASVSSSAIWWLAFSHLCTVFACVVLSHFANLIC